MINSDGYINFSFFKDSKHQIHIEKHGYTVLQFLNDDEVSSLRHFYNTNPFQWGYQFHSSILSSDSEYKAAVRSEIYNRFDRAINDNFIDTLDKFYACFTVKDPGENGIWDPHMDWSIVDERKAATINIWCATQDVDKTNGCLWVLPGSHKYGFTYRGSNIDHGYEKVKEELRELMIPLPMKKGEAVAFYMNTLHYSDNNLSQEKRISANIGLVSELSQTIHYFKGESGNIDVYSIDSDFMIEYQINSGKPLDSKNLLRQEQQALEYITPKQLTNLFKQHSQPLL